MKLILQTPAKALLPAYRIQHVERGRLERFKTELVRLFEQLEHSAQESEEHLKNIVSDFLKGAFYRDEHFVNTKDRQDLVIHNGRTAKDSVGVIIEAKKPGNKSEMITAEKPNTKALQELLRYYLNERKGLDNKEIRNLIVTDIYNWYIFDAADFERHIYVNSKLLKQYADWSEGRLGAGNTDWFYKEIAAPFFEKELPELRCCHFDLRKYVDAATNDDAQDDDTLLDLYKILSPQHLLKKPFANDSNALNKQFYDELLYILGLEEEKDGGKKLINRATKRRHDGSLLENTLSELEISAVWRDATGLEQFGETPEEQRYSIALELCITWLNRILFLKLLEGQLIRWRGGERLLSVDKVKDYDELNELFFHVLAVPEDERRASVQQQFGNIPYLNSSLFEQTELERRTLRVSALKDRLEMPVLPHSVLRQGANPPARMQTLNYLFAFLDAYDFSSDAKARIQSDNRAVINASVLGLIFEKINGYRDGSFFTPGFITMYMCRETLRRAVLQKFNERYSWDCQNVETELHNELIRHKTPFHAANDLINSLRICDPAVGSGHFLVSALNELIAIKSDLGILCDPAGKLLQLNAVVGNDELILTDPQTDQPIDYQPGNTASQRIQETLFHEKQTLIENCLFGVDINPKSVMICRLRLWIELLKHAYFRADSKYQRLETLPNIDINIKTGNSLVSRFALEEDLKQALKKSKWSVEMYRMAVHQYHHASNKDEKSELERLISEIKGDFRTEIGRNDPKVSRLQKLTSELYHRFTGNFLFEPDTPYGGEKHPEDSLETKRNKEKAKIEQEITKLSAEIEEIKNNKIYKNAFEWRFEFPEVLDDQGNYVGFDCVIGNPPYISLSKMKEQGRYFESTKYETYSKGADIYCLFYERGTQILRHNGTLTFITSNSWLRAIYGDLLKQFFKKNTQPIQLLNIEDAQVFEEATVESNILTFQKTKLKNAFNVCNLGVDYELGSSLSGYFSNNAFLFAIPESNDWTIGDQSTGALKLKIEQGATLLKDLEITIYRGIITGLNEAFVIDEPLMRRLIDEDVNNEAIIKPILRGRDLKKYNHIFGNYYLINSHNGLKKSGIKKVDLAIDYPTIYAYLNNFLPQIEIRQDKGDHWSNLRNCAYLEDFDKPKIVWGEISDKPKFSYDEEGFYAEATTFFLTGERLKYLLAILNSKVSEWYFNQISTTTGMGTNRWKKYKIELLPIKIPTQKQQNQIEALVTRILTLKQTSPSADTSALEAEVDGLVYGLYGLTEEEIGIVEGGAGA